MQKSFLVIVLSTAFLAGAVPAAGQDDADLQAGQVMADFYQTASNILTTINDANPRPKVGGMSFGLTWDDVLYGRNIDNAASALAALSAAAKALDSALAGLPGRQLRLSGLSLTAAGPELSFVVANQP